MPTVLARKTIVLPKEGINQFTGTVFDNQFSMFFDGANDYINLGNQAIYDFDGLTDPFSLSAWFKTSVTGQKILVSKQGGTNNKGWRIRTASNRIDFHISGGSGTDRIEVRSENLNTADGNWHHVVYTYSGSGLASGTSLIFDGVDKTAGLVPQVDTLLSSSKNTFNAQICGRNGTSGTWDGSLDEISIWNKKLTVAEAVEIYSSGTPADLLVHSAAANLIGWWRLGDGDTNDFPTIADNSNSIKNGTAINMLLSSINIDVPT